MLHEGHEVVELDQSAVLREQGAVEKRRLRRAGGDRGPRPTQRDVVEAPAMMRHQCRGDEVADVEGLQRVVHDHLVTRPPRPRRHVRCRCRCRCVRGAIDHIQQLAERDGGRANGVGALVAAAVRDQQVVGRGQQGIEQELPVLVAGIAVADSRGSLDDVVPVRGRATRERAVVEAEETDDPVGHRAHRHESAHRQVPRAEVRPGRPPPQTVGEDGSDLGQRDRHRDVCGQTSGLGDDIPQEPIELEPLPGVPVRRRRQGIGRGGNGDRPRIDRLRLQQVGDRGVQPVDQLGEPSGQVDVAAVDVVERQDATDESHVVLGHGDAQQQAIQSGPPRVRFERVEVERGAMGRIQSPTDARSPPPTLRCDRVRRRRGRNRRRTGDRLAKSITWEAVIREVGSSRSSATTASTGLV